MHNIHMLCTARGIGKHSPAVCDSGPRAAQDMEKLAAKQGVVLQTVKDVVDSLVNDDLIHEDRIGISKYYWCARKT